MTHTFLKTPLLLSAATATLLLSGATVRAQSLPSLNQRGSPSRCHQAQILGLADIEERLPDPTFARSRTQCSPHLVAALKARSHFVAKLILVKLSSRGYGGGA